MTSLPAEVVSTKPHVFSSPNSFFPSFCLAVFLSLFYSFIREGWLFDAGLWFSFKLSLSLPLSLSLFLVLSCSLQAMRCSPPCSAGAAGALGYLKNINDSKQPEELPGETDASRSMGRNQYICVCIKIHKTVLTSHLLPSHRSGRPAALSKTRAMGFKNRPARLTDSIYSDQNGFSWMDASLKPTAGLCLGKKGKSQLKPCVCWGWMDNDYSAVFHMFNDSNVLEYRHRLFIENATSGKRNKLFFVLYIFYEHAEKQCSEQHVWHWNAFKREIRVNLCKV